MKDQTVTDAKAAVNVTGKEPVRIMVGV